jgi:hypothetical protein
VFAVLTVAAQVGNFNVIAIAIAIAVAVFASLKSLRDFEVKVVILVIVSAAVVVVLDILRVDIWRDALDLGLGLDRVAVECGHVGGV